jgi:hypothetical protein
LYEAGFYRDSLNSLNEAKGSRNCLCHYWNGPYWVSLMLLLLIEMGRNNELYDYFVLKHMHSDDKGFMVLCK